MRTLRILPLFLALGLVLALPVGSVRAGTQATLAVTMSNPVCVQPTDSTAACYIVIRSIQATASDTSFSNLDITIDGRVRGRMNGFFESSASAYSRMFGRGFQVTCGFPNASGNPAYGRSYQVGYAGYLFGVSGPAASGTATVFCPAFKGTVDLPKVSR